MILCYRLINVPISVYQYPSLSLVYLIPTCCCCSVAENRAILLKCAKICKQNLKKQRKVMQVDTSKYRNNSREIHVIKMKGPCSTLLFLAIVIENFSVISLINVIISHLQSCDHIDCGLTRFRSSFYF